MTDRSSVLSRLVVLAVSALLLFEATAAPPETRGVEPSATPAVTSAPSPDPTPAPSVAPSTAPVASTAPAPTIAPTRSPDRTDVVSPSGVGPKTGATELVGARTETSRTFDNHDGTRTSEFFTAPVFYRPSGSTSYEPIAAGFSTSPVAGEALVSDKAPVAVRLAEHTTRGDFLSLVRGDQRIGFRLPPDLATIATDSRPVVDGAVADYADFTPGVDLRVSAGALGAKSFFIWRTAPLDPTLRYVVDAPGLRLVAQKDGSIALLDGKGALVASIPHPYAVDSSRDAFAGGGRFSDAVSLELGADGVTVTVRVDPAWLTSAVYPVYVDPSASFASTNNTFDAHTASLFPSTNFAAYKRPDAPGYYELWLGLDPSGTSGTSYDYLQWDLSSIAGTTVESASLSIFPYHQYYDAPTVVRSWIQVPTATWAESTIKWSNQPSAGANIALIDSVEGAMASSNSSSVLNATVQGWLAGGTNRGLRLSEDGNGATYWKRLTSSENGAPNRPTLTVTYHTPVSPLYPTAGGATSSRTLTWSADGPWASATAFHVDLSTDNFATILATSGDVTSGATSWAVPAGTLVPGTTYQWRVKAKAGTTWTPFSSAAAFTYDLATLGSQAQERYESWDLGSGDSVAVNVATLNALVSHPLVTLPIRGGSTSLGLTFNSEDPGADIGVGAGWRLNVQRRLTLNVDGTVTFIDADGARYRFSAPVTNGTVTTYTRPAALMATLVKDTSITADEFILIYRDQSRDKFDILGSEAILVRTEDRFANGLSVAYAAGTTRISSIADTAGGRSIALTWDGTNTHVSSITDWAVIDGSGVVQTSGTPNRTYRFFYTGANLAGWADPLNTAGSCPTAASHLTCLTYTNGLLTDISKTQTVESLSAGAITTTPRTVTTTLDYGSGGAEVRTVADGEQTVATGNTFARTTNAEVTVVRKGTPDTTTRYVALTPTDPYGRIASVYRKLGAGWIEQRTAYGDAGFPSLPTAVSENNGGSPTRTVTTSYVTGSLGNVAKVVEPLTATSNRWTEYVYNANNDVTSKTVSLDGSGTDRTVTRSCYATQSLSCPTTEAGLTLVREIEHWVSGGNQNADTNVATDFAYDAYGQRTRATRHNRSGAGVGVVRDDRVTGFVYDNLGNPTASIENYVDGVVSAGGQDVTADASSVRTDLTTSATFDTAGNRVSSADPRRAILVATGSPAANDYLTRWSFDALDEQVTEQTPATPGSATVRTSSQAYDELGAVRASTDIGGVLSATAYDRAGRALETYQDTDGAGGIAAAKTSITTVDAAGRTVAAYDRTQVPGGRGYTKTTYDELGRVTAVLAAYGTTDQSETDTGYDGLDRQVSQEVGVSDPASQLTSYTLDLGGRVLRTDDGFTCKSSTFDYRDLVQTSQDALDPGTCATNSGSRTVTNSHDGLGRLILATVTAGPGIGDRTTDDTLDAIGNHLVSSGIQGGVTTTTTATINLLDATITEARSDASSAKTTFDAAGNAADACYWAPGATVGACNPVGTTPWPNPPTRSTTTVSDAQNQRVSLAVSNPDGTTLTTTYDPDHLYQPSAVYLPTGTGREHQTFYHYDARHRLADSDGIQAITQRLCVVSSGHACSSTVATGSDTYLYDDNDSRSRVAESNGATTVDRYYCHDARNQLITVRSAAGCASGLLETYAYDDVGNRTAAPGRTFTYSATSQLTACTGPSCTVAYDDAGRIATLTENGVAWTYGYDAEGRLISACKSAAPCPGSGVDRVDFGYDSDGHRTKITETPAAGSPVTVTDFRYQGDAVIEELVTKTGVPPVTRSFVVDETGKILRMTTSGDASAGTYLVVWNGHGDATGLWRINADGSLTLANSFTYDTWGTPTLATANGYPDLGFRYRYVGASGVAWDDQLGLGLAYMHARHYRPSLGRFIQPDPAAAESNLYGYVGNGPVTMVDPGGRFWYPVKVGDSVYSLATRFRVTVASILAWNRRYVGPRSRRLCSGMCLWINRRDITQRSPYFQNGRCTGTSLNIRTREACPAVVIAATVGHYVTVGIDIGFAVATFLAAPSVAGEVVMVPLDASAFYLTYLFDDLARNAATHRCSHVTVRAWPF